MKIFKRFLHFFNQCISHKENKYVNLKSGFADSKHGVVEAQELQILLLGHHITTMIGLILETVILKLPQPTSRTYVKTRMLRLVMLCQNGT